MRPAPLICALYLACTLSLAAQEKSEVIYPRGTAPAGAVTGKDDGRTHTFLLLGTAAVAAAGGWWLWQKRRLAGGGSQVSRLNIVESRSLGSRQYLVVADYDGRKFLLGVCPGSIEMLTPLDGTEPPQK